MTESATDIEICTMCSVSTDSKNYLGNKHQWSSTIGMKEVSINVCNECHYFLAHGVWKPGSVYPMGDECCFACERPSFEKYKENEQDTIEQKLIFQRNKAIEGFTLATYNFRKAIIKLQEYELIIKKQQEQLNRQ
jgi:hypothetical protein